MQLPHGEYPAETASSLVEKYFLFSSFVFLAEAQEELWNTCDFLLPTKLPLFLFDLPVPGLTLVMGISSGILPAAAEELPFFIGVFVMLYIKNRIIKNKKLIGSAAQYVFLGITALSLLLFVLWSFNSPSIGIFTPPVNA